MYDLTFRLDEKGIETVFKPYQSEALRLIHEKGHMTSGEVDTALKRRTIKISRASVIFFLNAMVDEELLLFTLKSGKGGFRRVYKPTYPTYSDFIKALYQRFADHLRSELLGDIEDV